MACPRRTARPSLEALIATIYLRYARYLSPLNGEPCSALEAARLLAARRRHDAETAGVTHILGVHPWKDFHVEPFLKGRRTRLTYAMLAGKALRRQKAEGGRIVVWASREPAGLAERCSRENVPLYRMEDGFLHSVGLGANLEPPASLVLDARGIYYDPSSPSDLEHLLQTETFGASLLDEAAELRRLFTAARLSKYNVGSSETGALFDDADGRLKVLVPGQVANDASVVRGGGAIRDNLALLEAARAPPRRHWPPGREPAP